MARPRDANHAGPRGVVRREARLGQARVLLLVSSRRRRTSWTVRPGRSRWRTPGSAGPRWRCRTAGGTAVRDPGRLAELVQAVVPGGVHDLRITPDSRATTHWPNEPPGAPPEYRSTGRRSGRVRRGCRVTSAGAGPSGLGPQGTAGPSCAGALGILAGLAGTCRTCPALRRSPTGSGCGWPSTGLAKHPACDRPPGDRGKRVTRPDGVLDGLGGTRLVFRGLPVAAIMCAVETLRSWPHP